MDFVSDPLKTANPLKRFLYVCGTMSKATVILD